MLRELLRDNLDQLLLTVEKIGRAFEIVTAQKVNKNNLLEIKRLIHSLKGNLQSIGLNDEAEFAIKLEEQIFKLAESVEEDEVLISKSMVDSWFTQLNEIEFSLKSYLF